MSLGARERFLRVARTTVRRLPVSQAARARMIDTVYRFCGSLFKGTVHYEYWRRSRSATCSDKRVAEVLQKVRARADRGFDLPVSEDPEVSIVVPTYGRADLTLNCLAALAQYPPAVPFEVIVSEDASGDPDADSIGRIRGVRYHRNEANLGFVLNCNGAAASARGRYLLFLNNDTVGLPGWVDSLVEVMRREPRAGVVGAKLLFPDGRLQEAGAIVWSDGSAWNYGRSDDSGSSRYNFMRATDYCSGAALMIRRAVFNELEGFDPVFVPAYYEDADLCFRARALGYQVLYQPESEVVHMEGASNGTDLDHGVKSYQIRNGKIFFKRWEEVLTREHRCHGDHLALAAARVRGRQAILVIDRYPPRPDRDAGSRSVFDLIVTLRELGWDVGFWPETLYGDPDAIRPLERLGVEVAYGKGLIGKFGDWFAERKPAFAHAIVNRPPLDSSVIDLLIEEGVGVIYYGHDIHFRRLALQARLAPGSVGAADVAASEAREREIWGKVQTVLYPSDDEVALVRDAVPHVRAVRIPLFSFRGFKPERQKPRGVTALFVGGAGHPPNRDAVEWLAADIVPLIRKTLPDFQIRIVGAGFEEQAGGSPGIVPLGAVSDAELARLYDESDIALVPLSFGAGLKGKIIEAMAQGMPVVTTDCGAEGLAALPDAARVANDADSIAAAVVSLLGDGIEYARLSRAGLALTKAFFDQRAMRDFALDVFGRPDGHEGEAGS